MKRMVTGFLIGLVIISCNKVSEHPLGHQPQVNHVSQDGQELDQFIRESLPEPFSGTVLVEHHGQVLLHAAYGYSDPQQHTPPDTQLAYWLGSLSKQFAATAIMKLVDQGKLHLSDTLGSYFPDVPPDKRRITIHQLLTHTSGLPDRYSADGVGARDRAVKLVLDQKLIAVPGEKYSYSNDAYSLVAALIEIASGQTFEAFMNEELLKPIDLTGVGFAGDKAAWNKLNVAGRALGASKEGSPQLWRPDWGYKGATGALATAGALRQWFHAIWNDSILSHSSREALFSGHIVTKREGLSYAYGWYRLESRSGSVEIFHSGDDDFIGHSSSLRWYADQTLLVIVLSNGGYWNHRGVAAVVAEQLAERALRTE